MKHDVFSRAMIPRRHLRAKTTNGEAIEDWEARHEESSKSSTIWSKIFNHFIKGKNSFITHGVHIGNTWWVGIIGKFGQVGKEEA
jgi:hypothetical protein